MPLDTIEEVLGLFKGGCGPAQVPPGEVSVIIYPDPQPPEQFTTVDTTPSFVSLFEELVGDTGSPLDNYNADILEVVAIIDALDAALGKGAENLFEAFGFVEAIGPDSIAEDVLAFAASVPVGDAILQDAGGLALPEAPPPAPQPPPVAPPAPPPGPPPPGGGPAPPTTGCEPILAAIERARHGEDVELQQALEDFARGMGCLGPLVPGAPGR